MWSKSSKQNLFVCSKRPSFEGFCANQNVTTSFKGWYFKQRYPKWPCCACMRCMCALKHTGIFVKARAWMSSSHIVSLIYCYISAAANIFLEMIQIPSKFGTDQSSAVCMCAYMHVGVNLLIRVCVLVLVVEEEGWWRFLIYRPQAAFEALISSHHIVLAHPLVQQGAENSPCNTVPSRSLSLTLSPPLPPPLSHSLSHLTFASTRTLATSDSIVSSWRRDWARERTGRTVKDRERQTERGRETRLTYGQGVMVETRTFHLHVLSVSSFKGATSNQKNHTSMFPSRLASLWLLLFVNVFFFEYL